MSRCTRWHKGIGIAVALLLTLLVCVPAGWRVALAHNRAKKRAGIRAIENMGGLTGTNEGPTSLIPTVWRCLSGWRYGDTVTRVDLSDCPITDNDLDVFAELSDLEEADLSGTGVTDAGIGSLTGHDYLRKIHLRGTAISDSCMRTISKMPIEYLDIDDTNITDHGLESIAGLISLRKLTIRGTRVTEEGIRRLKTALPDLEVATGSASPAHEKCPARQRPFGGFPLPGEGSDIRKLRAGGVPAMMNAARHGTWYDRATAIDLLGEVRPKAQIAIPLLTELLQDRDSTVRECAAGALGKIGDNAQGTVGPLVRSLHDNDLNVRRVAAQALGKIDTHSTEVVSALSQLLLDENADVRCAAIRSLGQIGPDAKVAIPTLARLSEDQDRLVSCAAKEAIRNITVAERERKENGDKSAL